MSKQKGGTPPMEAQKRQKQQEKHVSRRRQKVGWGWAIAGTGRICNDFCASVKSYSLMGQKLRIAASRDEDRVTAFCKKFLIHYQANDYSQLASEEFTRKVTKAVFVGTPTEEHCDIVKLMLDYGKSVVCARPLGRTRAEVNKLMNYAALKKCFLMEFLWPRFTPMYQLVWCITFSDPYLGMLESIHVTYGHNWNQPGVPERPAYRSCVDSLATDALSLIIFLFRDPPIRVEATGITNEGYDEDINVTMHFEKGRKAVMRLSTTVVLENEAHLHYSKGDIRMIDFWCCKSIGIKRRGKEERVFDYQENDVPTKIKNGVLMRYARHGVLLALEDNQMESEIAPLQDTELIALIIDELRSQLDVEVVNPAPEDPLEELYRHPDISEWKEAVMSLELRTKRARELALMPYAGVKSSKGTQPNRIRMDTRARPPLRKPIIVVEPPPEDWEIEEMRAGFGIFKPDDDSDSSGSSPRSGDDMASGYSARGGDGPSTSAAAGLLQVPQPQWAVKNVAKPKEETKKET